MGSWNRNESARNYSSHSLRAFILEEIGLACIEQCAPSGDEVVAYDRQNLALYAALLEADDLGQDWRDSASSLMDLDVTDQDSEACWRSHLERARWIIGDGMASAIVAFNIRPEKLGSR